MKTWIIVVALLQAGLFVSCKNNANRDKAAKRRPDSVTMVSTDTMIQATDTNIVAIAVPSWVAFKEFNGKYVNDVKLFDQEPLKARFKALLGEQEKAFLERHKTTPPVEVEQALLFTEGCRPHDCGVEESALVIDMKKDMLYAGIAINKQVHLFAEKGDTTFPAVLIQWKAKFAE